MSQSSIVRVSAKSKAVLDELARESGESMLSILDKAIEEYRRRQFLDDVNSAYERLRSDSEASDAFDAEIQAWDPALMDGVPADEPRSTDKPRGRTKANKP